ncbi:hypothetical protein N7447_004563 [Penicillium robsamsonii]|uniref:uncharacterized protein n=1 Tax=Penicillium robsamsonii TaxID=1792511 RepID=UPI002547DA76|nr:uncharacterized protein N7447_004563 [Penicillium robsamsonii]KAJ5827800.1 hypothetical protein N7447_004563 [Penicillium robsamsonii]
MAAPLEKNTSDMTGVWVMQGVPWLVRKVLAYASVTLTMTHSTEPAENGSGDITKIRVKQTISPGGFSNEDDYILDSETREATVPIFGTIAMYAKYTPVAEIEDAELRARLVEGQTGAAAIQEIATNKGVGWDAVGTWGFEIIDGQRYFTRTTVTKKGDEKVSVRLVYDYRED